MDYKYIIVKEETFMLLQKINASRTHAIKREERTYNGLLLELINCWQEKHGTSL